MKRYQKGTYVMRENLVDKLFDKQFERVADAVLFLEFKDKYKNDVFVVMPKETGELEDGRDGYVFYYIRIGNNGLGIDELVCPKDEYKQTWRIWNSYPSDMKRRSWEWGNDEEVEDAEMPVAPEIDDTV